jgi:hypothetical protein
MFTTNCCIFYIDIDEVLLWGLCFIIIGTWGMHLIEDTTAVFFRGTFMQASPFLKACVQSFYQTFSYQVSSYQRLLPQIIPQSTDRSTELRCGLLGNSEIRLIEEVLQV